MQRDGDWERELGELCRGQWLGRCARAYATCPSTQPIAWQWVREGAPHGGIVVAREQTAGKGRFDRAWWTGQGGLALTVILRPDLPADRVGMFGWLAAAGLLRALAALGVEGKVKWPNDVLLHPDLGKWAGTLPQSALTGQRVQAVVIGIGFNVRRPSHGLPACTDQAAFLSDVGVMVDDQTALRHVLAGLQSVFDSELGRDGAKSQTPIAASPFQEWRRACVTLGQDVKVRVDDALVTGRSVDVTPEGALVVRQADGGERRIHAGEATIVKAI